MLVFHDSLSRQKKVFRPFKKGVVSMYHCGPTVYDYAHIGNVRSFLFADILRRFMEFKGYEVTQIMNITDVGHMLADADVGEDKMEAAAKKEEKSPQEIAAFYTEAFFHDIDQLNIKRALAYPRASAHVAEMIAIIEKLLAHQCAYRVGENVYFDVASFKKYGALSGNTLEGLEPGKRIAVRDEKKHPADFALWISNAQHVMQWAAPWGMGYPGWHIECSAMAIKYLGETIDIHTGGEDNKFPHHEAEIAQSECATGQPFARYWLHAAHLLVDGEKMSKSKGNFFTLADLLKKGFAPRDVRYALIAAHYRQQFNFTLSALDAAKAALSRLDTFVDAMQEATAEEAGRRTTLGKKTLKRFERALDDDLNVAAALAVVFDFVRDMNEKLAQKTLTSRDKAAALEFMRAVGEALGLPFGVAEDAIPPSVIMLVETREEARKERRFAEADRLRDEIKEKGYVVEDKPEGPRVKHV